MLSLPKSLPTEFLASYGVLLLAVAFAWALLIAFLFANTWRKRRHLLAQFLNMAITASFVAVIMYLPFIALALGVKWGWL